MIKKRQFTGTPFDGIIHQKAQQVIAPDRGISFNRPERFVVNTPTAQVEIVVGDWVLEMESGNRYVIKDVDIACMHIFNNKKWWHLW